MINKIFININFKILKILGLKYFLFFILKIFLNSFKIIKSKNLDILNNQFKKLNLNFYKKKFYLNISEIDKLSGESNSFGLVREIFFRNIYFNYFKFLNSKNIYCIDLGCNIGIFSLLASKVFKEVKSIDVNKKYIKPYKKIMNDNNVHNAEFLNNFIGSFPYNSEIKNHNSKIIDLNSFILSKNLKNIFLKIDIEGYEFQLFDNIDLNNIIALSMEVHPEKGNIDKLIDKISEFKFDYILANDLSEILTEKDKDKATYIFAVRSNSFITLNI